MPHLDAMEDGVPTKKDRYGMDWYYPNCHICGESVPSWSYIRGLSYTCPSCKKLMVQLKLEAEKETKKTAKLKTAAKRIARVADVSKYQDAIAWVEKNLHRSGWFQSTEEIMVALELICRRIKANHQVKVLDYRVDFVLPDYKVVLEIDGDIYHAKDKRQAQALRDEVIAAAFGEGWQVIHISTENINTNVTKLIPAIKRVLAYRKCAH